jgi:L-ascorbate metabolism protein UlaG (beta-lactamase superfamily)
MKYTWLGHASIRLEIGNQVLLIDPWLDGNPSFPDDRRAEALSGATAILVTHAHFDHLNDVATIAAAADLPVYAIVELAAWLAETAGLTTTGFNKGGTVQIGDVAVTMVGATHSSSAAGPDGTSLYLGEPAGFMIAGEGRTVYVSGDTDVMADMGIWNDLHQPEIGILCAGGHFTMDMTRAAYAATKLFAFKTVIPVHYKTFPLLAQDASALIAGAPDAQVLTPEVMDSVTL